MSEALLTTSIPSGKLVSRGKVRDIYDAGDDAPATTAGLALSLADKLDSLVGLFAAGAEPSGSADPFGLRRAALGIVNAQLREQAEAAIKDKIATMSVEDVLTDKAPIIEELTARGISTNNTLSFVLPQLVDCAESVKRGLERAKKNGVDLSKWRSVITHMEGRFGDLGDLRGAAAEQGIELTEGEVRQAELAVFKKAYKYLEDNNLPSKMLSCSLKIGPTVNGEKRIWHLEEKSFALASGRKQPVHSQNKS